MNVPFLDLQAQYQLLKDEVIDVIGEALNHSAYALGPWVEHFEERFAAYRGAKYCICVNSGTSALVLLLRARNIGPGDEVITVTNSFFATLEAIVHVGATPVLVDCEEDSALINPRLIEHAITSRTKAIIPVHLYGQCADVDEIKAIADRHGLRVIEDACQAHGALYKGKRAGSLAHGSAFSFYPGKNLGAYGEGGAIVTDDPAIADMVGLLRNHGSRERYHHEQIGWNERMDGIQGAVLGVKLPHLETWNMQRREHAAVYRTELQGYVEMISERSYGQPVYHLFVIRHTQRTALQQYLQEHGIQTSIHYPIPIHLQPAFTARWKAGPFPVAEKLASEILSLPMYPELTHEQRSTVIQGVIEGAERIRNGQV